MEATDTALEWREALPTNIRNLWEDVCKAMNTGAFGLVPHGTRTLVNRVAMDLAKAKDSDSLAESVRALRQAGYISARDEERLRVVIEAGNATMHRGLDLTAHQTGVLVHIVENLLRSAYLPQATVDAVKKVIPPRGSGGRS